MAHHEILTEAKGCQCAFEIDTERRMVLAKFGKKITAEHIQGYARHLQANPSFNSDFAEIADLRDVEELDLNADEFIKLADEVDPFSEEAKRAFVVRTPVQAHAARMHKALRLQRKFEIFKSLEEAERWISKI